MIVEKHRTIEFHFSKWYLDFGMWGANNRYPFLFFTITVTEILRK